MRRGLLTSDVEMCIRDRDYTAENWKQVQKILADAADRIHQAADMEAVDAIRTEALASLQEIETIAGAQERKLQEAKDCLLYTSRTGYLP